MIDDFRPFTALAAIAAATALSAGCEPAPPACPEDPLVQTDVAYGSDAEQVVDIHRSEATPPDAPIVVFVHGGAWTGGHENLRDCQDGGSAPYDSTVWNPRDYVDRAVVVSVRYRLLDDDTTALDQVADVSAAVRWVREHAAEIGGDPHRVVAWGHSAGAHLVALAAARTDAAQRPDRLILFAGVFDFRPGSFTGLPTSYDYVAGNGDPGWEAVTLDQYALTDFPRTLVAVGSADELVPVDQSVALSSLLQDARLYVPEGLGHSLDGFDPAETDALILVWDG